MKELNIALVGDHQLLESFAEEIEDLGHNAKIYKFNDNIGQSEYYFYFELNQFKEALQLQKSSFNQFIFFQELEKSINVIQCISPSEGRILTSIKNEQDDSSYIEMLGDTVIDLSKECNGKGEIVILFPENADTPNIREDVHPVNQILNGGKNIYWQDLLSDFEPIEIHVFKSQDGHKKTVNFEFDYALFKEIIKISEDIRVEYIVLAVFYILIYKYSGQNDVLVNLPITEQLKTKTQIGVIPVRIELDDSLSVLELAKQLQMNATSLKGHEISLEEINNIVPNNLLDIIAVIPTFSNNIASLQMFHQESCQSYKTQLSLFILCEASKIKGQLICSNELYPDSLVSFYNHFDNMIKQFVKSPNQIIQDYDFLLDTEYQQIIHEWNNTDREYPQHKTFLQLFQEQVEKTPEQVALFFEDQAITYKQLDEKSNQLARYLRFAYQEKTYDELLPDTLIAICITRCLETFVGIIAILKAGAAYVPIDPEFPEERIKFILEDTKAELILIKKNTLQIGEHYNSNIICIDFSEDLYEQQNADKLPQYSLSTNLAYVIYTSGTTGKPKGTALTHKNLVNLIHIQKEQLNIQSQMNILQYAPIVFDASVWEIYSALAFGAILFIIPSSVRKDANLVCNYLDQHNINLATLPPALLSAMDYKQLPRLHTLIVAGEVCPENVMHKWGKARSFINAYGPTESTVCVTMHNYMAGDLHTNIGKPLSNIKVFVLDQNCRPVPVGVTGELYVCGVGLARGYLNNLGLTRERFISNPFASNEDISKGYTRLYKTGDLVRWLPDGNLEYMGRNDFQVKIRGYRIELGEIENTVSMIEGIQQAVVVVKGFQDKEENIQKQLICYYVRFPDSEVSEDSILNYLQTHLAEYMIPDVYIPLDAIPLTHTGKVDKQALLDMLDQAYEKQLSDSETPQTATEKKLAEIWRSLLKVNQIARTDGFFRLGGHSLIVPKLISQIKISFKVTLKAKDIYTHLLLMDLATFIDSQEQQGSAIHNTVLLSSGKTSISPLPFQKAMYDMASFDRMGAKTYTIPLMFEVDSNMNKEKLSQAVDYVLNLHDTFSVGYQLQANDELLLQKKEIQLKTGIVDCSDIFVLEQKLKEEAQITFDLERDILINPKLFFVKKNCLVISLVHHHAILDGYSIGKLLQQIFEIYVQMEANIYPLKYVSSKYSYIDYISWWYKEISNHKDKAIKYWQENYPTNPYFTIPESRSRLDYLNFEGNTLAYPVEAGLYEGLKKACTENGLTSFNMFLSAFLLTLAKYTNELNVTVGIPLANRDLDETQDILGCLINTLPLGMEINPRENILVKEFCQVVFDKLIALQEVQNYPLDLISDDIRDSTPSGFNPDYQVLFVSEKMSLEHLGKQGQKIKLRQEHNHTSKVDFSFYIFEYGLETEVVVEYNAHLFKQSQIKHFIACYFQVLSKFVKDPTIRLHEISLLDDQSKDQIAQSILKGNSVSLPNDDFISKFLRHVDSTPNKIAIKDESLQLTYKELGQFSNCLAQKILECLQSKPNMSKFVAFYVDRNIWSIVSTLAILKAGCAYVPLNQSYPNDRLVNIIEDSGADILITQKHFLEKTNKFKAQADVICLEENITSTELQELKSIERDLQSVNYLIYTSGTTGTPNGVMIQDQAILNLAAYCIEQYQLSSDDIIGQFCSFSFDTFCLDWVLALYAGASLYIFSESVQKDTSLLIERIQNENITYTDIPTAVFKSLSHQEQMKLSNLHIMKVGGENLQGANICSNLPFRLVNAYGPTEATVECLVKEITTQDQPLNNIGKPIQNMHAYILDQSLQPVPYYATGELYLSGIGLMPSYHNRDVTTNSRLIKNHLDADADNGEYSHLYKTGDIVRLLPNNSIEYIGRVDKQVKVRGHRIELAEIESTLTQYDGVLQSIVVYEDNNIFAYFVSEQGITSDILKQYLNEKLPGYMVPSQLIKIDEIPLTFNGKVDTKQLPKPNENILQDKDRPENDVEVFILELWQKLLKQKNISVLDNFFHLGGHSILVNTIVREVNKKYACKLLAKDVYTNNNIRALAKTISDQEIFKRLAPSKAIRKQTDTVFALPSQQAIALQCSQQGIMSKAYTVPVIYEISHQINIDVFKQAVKKLIERQNILKCRFEESSEGFYQVFDVVPYELKVIETTSERIKDILHSEANYIFNLSKGPLFRPLLLKEKGKDVYSLSLSHHHVIADGTSIQILVQEIFTLYEQLLGLDAHMSEIPYQYADYCDWYYAMQDKPEQIEMLKYWQNFCDKCNPIVLENDKNEVSELGNGKILSCDLSQDLTKQIRMLAKEQGVTPFILVSGLFQLMLARLSNQSTVTVGVPVSGRQIDGSEKLIGCFINTLPLTTNIDMTDTVSDYISQLNQKMMDLQSHQSIYLYDIQKASNQNVSDLFKTLIVSEQFEENNIALKYNIRENYIHNGTAKYDMSFFYYDEIEKIHLVYEYSSAMYSDEKIKALKYHFVTFLQNALQNYHRQILHIQLVSQLEYNRLVNHQNMTSEAIVEYTLIQNFDYQVEKKPQEIALVCGNDKFTYYELNAKANQLARYIQANGVNKLNLNNLLEQPIALFLERDANMIIAIIAVLKVGAAYIPIDVKSPKKRIHTILNESKPVIILSAPNVFNQIKEEVGANTIYLSVEDEQLSSYSSENLLCEYSNRNLAYIMFTSGSTGMPKGTLVEHRSVINTVSHLFKIYQAEQSSVTKIATYSAYVFDVFVSEMWVALLQGCQLHLLEDNIRENISLLSNYLKFNHINYAYIPPAVLPYLEKQNYPDLNAVIIAGETCEMKTLDEWQKFFKIYNYYGPTEATIYVTGGLVASSNSKNIGLPIQNMKAYVLDDTLNPVPVGFPGQLYVSGVGLARGYLHRDDLTEMYFVPNPFHGHLSEDYKRMYKTGDIVQKTENGSLVFLGRNDDQIKLNGQRVEKGEIENAIAINPNVKQVVVKLAFIGGSGHKLIIAYIVGNNNIEENNLREHCLQYLSSHMVPSFFIFVDNIPLNASGKISFDQLPLPELEQISEDNIPQGELENLIGDKVIEICGITQISRNKNIFNYGMRSLQAMQLAHYIANKVKVIVTASDIYKYTSIKKLAKHIASINSKDLTIITPFRVVSDQLSDLFLFHTARGSAEVYKLFSSFVDINVYGVESYNLYHNARKSYQELVDLYYKHICQSTHSMSNIKLGGWSFGGLLALSVAQKIYDQHGILPDVILFDTLAPEMFKHLNSLLSKQQLADQNYYEVNQSYQQVADDLGVFFEEKYMKMCFSVYKGRVILIKSLVLDDYEDLSDEMCINIESLLIEKYSKNGWDDIIPNLLVKNISIPHERIFNYGHESEIATLLKPYLAKTKE